MFQSFEQSLKASLTFRVFSLTPFLQQIADSGCTLVWTGGWMNDPGKADSDAWRWYYTNDVSNGPSDPVTYLPWALTEPNGGTNEQALAIFQHSDWKFVDISEYFQNSCYLCEYQ